MQSFADYSSATITEGDDVSLDILGIIKTYSGSAQVDIEDDYIVTDVPTMRQVDQIIAALPDDIDYEVLVHSINDDFDSSVISTCDDDDSDDDYDTDDDHDIDLDNIPDNSTFHLIIYTYNTSDDDDLTEVKRRIKINSKGKRRVKMQCKKGFKYDGKKCVKISGKELVNKRRAVRKSVRTKKSKGSGYQKRIARLRNRATKKRKGMGLRNYKK